MDLGPIRLADGQLELGVTPLWEGGSQKLQERNDRRAAEEGQEGHQGRKRWKGLVEDGGGVEAYGCRECGDGFSINGKPRRLCEARELLSRVKDSARAAERARERKEAAGERWGPRREGEGAGGGRGEGG